MTDKCHKARGANPHDILVKNFGCRLNNYEGELIKSQLTKMAHESKEQLQCVVINSCAVTSDAEKQVRQSIRRAARDYPDHKIIVTGCAAHINPQEYKSMEEVDAVVGNDVKTAAASYEFLNHKDVGLRPCPADGFFSFIFIKFAPFIRQMHEVFKLTKIKFFIKFAPFIRQMHEVFKLKEKKEKKLSAGQKVCGTKCQKQMGASPLIQTSTENFKGRIPAPSDRVRSHLEIQNGCDHRCTFCIIPFGRGDSRSMSAEEILRQLDSLNRQGIKEVTLSGVDITSYDGGGGHGGGQGGGFGNLLKRLCTNFPQMKFRLSSLDGIELGEEFLQAFADYKQICPHLHLSLQSGNDLILKRMKRRHSRADAIDLMHKLRTARSDVVFGADFICGFPTEDEAMFADTLSLVEEAQITWLHVFPYSERAGTAAARIPNQVPMGLRKMRVRQLRALGEGQSQNYMSSLVGTEQTILLERGGKGYTDTYAPVRLVEFDGQAIGDIIKVRMTAMGENSLLAEVI